MPSSRRLRLLTIFLWLATVPVMTAGWAFNMPLWVGIATIASVLFIISLMATLWLELPALPLPPPASAQPSFGLTTALLTVVLLGVLALGSGFGPWVTLTLALGLVALGMGLVWRHEVTAPLVVLAIVCGLACAGLGYASGDRSVMHFAYCVSVAFAIFGGGAMVRHLGLAPIYSAQGRWLTALGAFALGCVFALPSSLLNLASGIHLGDTWVDQLWEPLVALVPGIAEESIARLVLLTLCVFLLRGRPGASSWKVLAAALLISSYTHALAHLSLFDLWSPAGGMMVLAGFLFGLPMGLVFLRFGFEAAVGYHFMVDFVRFLAAYFLA